MKFNSAQEIYDYINSGKDLYDMDRGIYLFDYNAVGAIAYYYLGYDELLDLAMEAGLGNYVGAMLGPGGYIIDMELIGPDGSIIEYGTEAFDLMYGNDEYVIDNTDILEFLETLVDDEFISAMPEDLI